MSATDVDPRSWEGTLAELVAAFEDDGCPGCDAFGCVDVARGVCCECRARLAVHPIPSTLEELDGMTRERLAYPWPVISTGLEHVAL